MSLYTMLATAPTLTLRRDLARLMEDTVSTGSAPGSTPTPNPAIDITESATSYVVSMDVPGLTPDQIEVLVEEGALTVQGNRPARSPVSGERVLVAEQPRGAFVRRFQLPKSANLEAISATHAHGVLTLHIAKLLPAHPRRIEIQREPADATATD